MSEINYHRLKPSTRGIPGVFAGFGKEWFLLWIIRYRHLEPPLLLREATWGFVNPKKGHRDSPLPSRREPSHSCPVSPAKVDWGG